MHHDKAAAPFYARTVLQDGRVLPTLPPCACESCAAHAVVEERDSEEVCDAIRRRVRELQLTDPATWTCGPPSLPLDDEGARGCGTIPTDERAVPERDGRLRMAALGRGVRPSETRPKTTRVDVPGHQHAAAHPRILPIHTVNAEPDRVDLAASQPDHAPSAAVEVTGARRMGASVVERVPTFSPRTLPRTPPVEAALFWAAANDRTRTTERIVRIAAAEEEWYERATGGDVRVAQETSSAAEKALVLSVAAEIDATNKLSSARKIFEDATRARTSAQATNLACEKALSLATTREQELQVTLSHVTEDVKAAESRLRSAMTTLNETTSSSSALMEQREVEAVAFERDVEDLSSRLGSVRLRIVNLRSAVEALPLPAIPEPKPLDETKEDQEEQPPPAKRDGEELRTGMSPLRKRRKQATASAPPRDS